MTAPTSREELLEQIAAKAREWAGHYSPHSDGQNTFVLFAEWVESLPAPAQAPAVSAEDFGHWLFMDCEQAVYDCGGLAEEILKYFDVRPREGLAVSSTDQSAPAIQAPHSSGERLPSSDAAAAGADTARLHREIERLRAALKIIAGSSDRVQAMQASAALDNIGAKV